MQTDFSVTLDTPPRFTISRTNTDALTPIEWIYATVPRIAIRFYRDYEIIELPEGAQITLNLKPFGLWNPTETLVQAVTWIKVEDDGDIYYYTDLNLATTEMQAYFTQSRERFRATAGGLTIESGDQIQALSFQAKINFNPAVEGEAPTPLSLSTYQDVIRFYPTITALTGGTSNALDSLATVGVTVPRLVAVSVDGFTRIYELREGTDAENSPYVIRPDDYDSGTPRVWVQEV